MLMYGCAPLQARLHLAKTPGGWESFSEAERRTVWKLDLAVRPRGCMLGWEKGVSCGSTELHLWCNRLVAAVAACVQPCNPGRRSTGTEHCLLTVWQNACTGRCSLPGAARGASVQGFAQVGLRPMPPLLPASPLQAEPLQWEWLYCKGGAVPEMRGAHSAVM